MSTMPMDNLEMRALEERHHLHQRATELKTKITTKITTTRENLRDNLSVTRQSREHFVPAALIATAAGLLSGYLFTGMFTER
jgi:hypothetical protein